ncbi:uncharacterized protein LOC122856783 isoform X2 [Aphidius gifuensis]|nr:uncharacterized protein LOC122856783 isoform X2 [Aphidius gifuensis]
METSTLTTSGRRWTSRVVENVNGLSGTRLPTSSDQKVRRILEDETWKKRGDKNNKNCVIKNYNIVSSKGELSRELIDDYKINSDYKKYKNSELLCDIKNDYYKNKNDKKKLNNIEINKEQDKLLLLRTKSAKGITKSSSVPANLKEGPSVQKKLPNDGILKKSSAFLERLTGDKKNINKSLFKKNLTHKRINSDTIGLKKSPSCQSLAPNSHSNNRVGVKKSVSFSSDTAFEGIKLNSLKKIAVHEAKVYRKGVLRDLNDINTLRKPKVKVEEEMSLLRAAKESDELSLNDLITRMCKSGLGKVDVNATDSSGRSVISYIAGNGASEILETLLTFSGSNPNLPDNEGNTPLHFAAQAGQVECLNILLQRNIEIELDARNIHGFTPLMKAAIQGRTKCAKILLFAGANPTLKDHGRGLRAEQWARYCGRHACADTIEKFSRHRLIDRTSCRWGSEPELATKVLQGKIIPIQQVPMTIQANGIKSKLKRVFRTNGSDKNFSIVSQLTSAAICASTPALPKPGDIQPIVKNLIRPLSVPQLRVTLVAPTEILEKSEIILNDKIDKSVVKPTRNKKKTK